MRSPFDVAQGRPVERHLSASHFGGVVVTGFRLLEAS